MRIILASASPRRRELLMQIGLDFEVSVSQVEERLTTDIPWQAVEQLSGQKAEAVFCAMGETEKDLLVIGADTVVAIDGSILGKPGNGREAEAMLRRLSGTRHQVYTGVTLLHRDLQGRCLRKCFHEETLVEFYPMTQQEIAQYVSTGDPLDKAGAYGIQGLCARYIKGIDGDYNNVVGLPAGRLYQEMKEWLQK